VAISGEENVSMYQMTVGADGQPVQLLAADGRRAHDARFDKYLADVDGPDGDEVLAGLYEDLVVVRRIDAEATSLQRQGELALWPPFLGQEAAQIGSGRALRPDDFVFSSYRETAVAYCRGVEVADMMRVWRGNANAGWDPFAVNMAPTQVIIGAQTLHATGYAMGIQFDGGESAAITYFGDGATSQGDVNESMVFAASFQAPVVFFCQNNQWAISEPVALQAHVPIAHRAPGFGIPSVRVDGNDVLVCLAATREALERARSGNGPSFIEAVTYRMGPHTTADDPTRYRDANELEDWRERDPIARFEAYLAARGILDDALRARVAAKADDVAARLRDETIHMPDPPHEAVFEHVYAEPNSWLDRQRDHYERYLAGLDAGHGPAAEGA
jgi:pyruvate dehydrogenase E1 component alpha subunit